MTREEAAALLGVSATANASEATKAWKKLAPNVHPDRGGTNAMFDLLTEAKDTLAGKPRAQPTVSTPAEEPPRPSFTEAEGWEPVGEQPEPAPTPHVWERTTPKKYPLSRFLNRGTLPALLGVVTATILGLVPAIANPYQLSGSALAHQLIFTSDPEAAGPTFSPWWITVPVLCAAAVLTVVFVGRSERGKAFKYFYALFIALTTIGVWFGSFPALLPAMALLGWKLIDSYFSSQ